MIGLSNVHQFIQYHSPSLFLGDGQVYERISWTQMSLSRSQTARCRRDQNSSSFMLEGTGLNLVLEENERLCKYRFDIPDMVDTCRLNH